MNAVVHQLSESTPDCIDIYSILGEPEDPSSSWNEVKSAQLSGYDYIFLSAKINSKLANKTSLSELLVELFQLLETKLDRAKIFIDTDSALSKPEFASFDVNWVSGRVKDFRISPVKNLEQKEFIRTLYEYSGMLIGTA